MSKKKKKKSKYNEKISVKVDVDMGFDGFLKVVLNANPDQVETEIKQDEKQEE